MMESPAASSGAGERPLVVRSYGHPDAEFAAEMISFDTRARWRRALSASGLLILGAVLSLPIPGWHLIGVPGCVIAAGVLARRRLREHVDVRWAEGPCPACGAQVRLHPGTELPLTRPCPECGEFLKLADRLAETERTSSANASDPPNST